MPKESKPRARKAAAEKSEGSTTRAKKGGAKAAKDGPKRPLSAFMYFCKDWRERVKAENPSASFGEVGKLLGAKWKELEDDDKTAYLEQAATDKARYEKEKEDGATKKAASAGSGDDDAEDDD